MFDLSILDRGTVSRSPVPSQPFQDKPFAYGKRLFDIVMSLALLPILIAVALCLLIINPFSNKGRLFFVQRRMGRDCAPFQAYKFRSMTDVDQIERRADQPLETSRITPLGRFIRKTRIDELPQVINVLKGDMSLIGPRPDYYDHALLYLDQVAGYRERYAVRPGISGLAQTELGYVEGIKATERKVQADLYYIENTSVRLEVWIFMRTLSVVARRAGA